MYIKFTAGLAVIIFFIIISIASQIECAVKPLLRSYNAVFYMLSKGDLSQLREYPYPYYQIVEEINKFPQNANFYFSPYFQGQQNLPFARWYLYVLLRYFTYPRKIFCFSNEAYNNDKDEYKRKFIGNAARYSDLEWIRARSIEYIILYRGNILEIQPASARIEI